MNIPRRRGDGNGRVVRAAALAVLCILGVGACGCGPSKEEAARKQAAQAAFARGMDAAQRLEEMERTTGKGSPELFGTALDAAEQATLLDPDAGPYWRLLGTLYATMRQDVLAGSLAEDALSRAVELDGRDAGARLQLAGLLMGRRAWSKALGHMEEAFRIDRKVLTRPLVADMCHAYVADGLAERGEDFLREVVDKGAGQETSAPRLCLAVLLHEQGPGDGKKAAEALKVADGLAADAKANPEDAAYAKALAQDWRGGAR